ncbi:MAG: methyltransferase domain-containing protein, partial [Actinobacteria bacterium]|nr:methyltransferase domain-containing protein [Actinomycetota bacterium]
AVLDLGAGAGAVTVPAAASVGPAGRIVAGDLVPAMVDRITALGLPNVESRELDAVSLEVPEESFDVVLAGFLLHIVPDRLAALREIARVLRSDGSLVFSVPGPSDDGGWWRAYGEVVAAFAARTAVPAGYQGSSSSWEKSARAAGFSVSEHTLRQVALPVSGPEAHWEWLLTHGTRWLYDALGESDRVDFREAVLNSLRRAHPTGGTQIIAGAEFWRFAAGA